MTLLQLYLTFQEAPSFRLKPRRVDRGEAKVLCESQTVPVANKPREGRNLSWGSLVLTSLSCLRKTLDLGTKGILTFLPCPRYKPSRNALGVSIVVSKPSRSSATLVGSQLYFLGKMNNDVTRRTTSVQSNSLLLMSDGSSNLYEFLA